MQSFFFREASFLWCMWSIIQCTE